MNSKQEIAKSDVVPRPFRKVGTLTHLGLQVMIRKFTDNAREVNMIYRLSIEKIYRCFDNEKLIGLFLSWTVFKDIL